MLHRGMRSDRCRRVVTLLTISAGCVAASSFRASADSIEGVWDSRRDGARRGVARRDGSGRVVRVRRTSLSRLDRSRCSPRTPAASRLGAARRRVGVVPASAARAADPADEGPSRLTVLENGDLTWTFEVESSGARGLRMHVEAFDLPPARSDLLCRDDPEHAMGPGPGRGPRGTARSGCPPCSERPRLELRVPACRHRSA